MADSEMIEIKEKLHALCVQYVKERMQAAEFAIEQARQAGTDDTKSSAGDKYETGREMAQQETNRNLAQLNEANKLMVSLNQIGVRPSAGIADLGSLVETNNGTFYLSISAGQLKLDGQTYYAVSPASPVGMQLKGKKAGNSFNLNGKDYKISSVVWANTLNFRCFSK